MTEKSAVAVAVAVAPPPLDPEETARFLREQPPLPIPRRTYARTTPGLIAYPLLGGQVIKSGG